MELFQFLITIVFALLALRYAWRILNWAWVKPTRLEKQLREQGLHGTSYRLLFGDTKELSSMINDAKSRPMSFSNDIVGRVIPFIKKVFDDYGKNSFFWLGPRPAVLITDPELFREVLSKSYTYQKPFDNPLTKLLAHGLASHETEKWAKHRRIINPAFSQDKLKHMLPAFYLSCCDMLSKWERIISSEQSAELNVWPYLQTLTSDAISRTAFGSNFEEGKRIFEMQKEQTELLIQFARSIYIPGWRFVPTKKNKRMLQLWREVNSSIFDIVTKKIKALEAGEGSHDDLLGILLQSNFTEIKEKGSKSGGMTMEEIIEECKLFYLAGQETTSTLLVWTMILLSKHLDWQARAREEVLNIFNSQNPDFDKLGHLKIVTMILYEVLRLYSPAVMLERKTTNKSKLGKMTLPAGVQLMMPTIMLHHDREIWGDDAKEFNPERFGEGVSKASKGQFAFFPFGWGPRICIGQNFVMLEAKMALAMILQCFSFELSPSYAHAPATLLSLQPQHGAPLRLCKL